MIIITLPQSTESTDKILGQILLTSVTDFAYSDFTINPTPPFAVSSPFQHNLYSMSPPLNVFNSSFLKRTSCKATTSTLLLPTVSVTSALLLVNVSTLMIARLSFACDVHTKVSSSFLVS